MIVKENFGYTAEGRQVCKYTLSGGGAELSVLDFGATVYSLRVPDRQGRLTDVVLGYDSVSEYEKNDGYLGATIGRVGNRIGAGRFSLNGKEYSLFLNDGDNHLHGGRVGFDRRLWQAETAGEVLKMRLFSPDGEEGYPGNLSVCVSFSLQEDCSLHILYEAETDADCPVSLTNHSYFNLNGGGTVLEHKLRLNADFYLENDKGCLPTGKLLPVDGAFDFRKAKTVGQDIFAPEEQLMFGGYDHNFVLKGSDVAVLSSEASGIELRVITDLPGVQLYTGNFLTERAGKGGSKMGKHGALCLETQMFPNAVNYPHFASPILKAGEKLRSETVFAFSNV